MPAPSGLSALEAVVDVVVVDLLGCASLRSVGDHKSAPSPAAERPHYSAFDLVAGCGAQFLKNLCITVIVPVALSSAESRGHDSPLSGSGSCWR